MAYNINDG
jgi:glycine dehydrogenase